MILLNNRFILSNMTGTFSKKIKRYIERIKNDFGLEDKHLSPLLERLAVKSESTQELYLICFKKWLECGGVFDDDTFIKTLKNVKPKSREYFYYALKFIYSAYGEQTEIQYRDVVPKSVRKVKEMLDKDEVIKIIDRVKTHEKPHIQFMFVLSTVYGMRRIEIYRLEKSDIDLKKRKFFVFTAKGGEPREHLIPDIIFPYFEEYYHYKNPRYQYIQVLNTVFDIVADNAGIELRPRLGWHSIRRCLVTELLKTDINPMIIRNFLRWKPRGSDILMEYTLYNPEEVDRTIFEQHPFLGYWDKNKIS